MNKIRYNHTRNKTVNMIVERCHRYTSRLSRFVNHKWTKLSPGKMKTMLIIFCITSSCLSIYIVFSYEQQPYIPVPIEVPAHIRDMGTTTIEQSSLIPPETFTLIQNYKQYMDSLNKPIEQGLLDTLFLLERIYQLK